MNQEPIDAELVDDHEQPGTSAAALTVRADLHTLAVAMRQAGHADGHDLDSWMESSLSKETRAAYRRDLRHFTRWLAQQIGADKPDSIEAENQLLWGLLLQGRLDGGPVAARRLVTRWQQEQLAAGLSSATVNRRLAALRWLSRTAALNEVADLRLELVRGPKKEATSRDVTGVDSLRALAQVVARAQELGRTDAERARNSLILHLLAWNALRRGELCRLSLADWDPADPHTLRVRRKGKRERKAITLPDVAVEAMHTWLEHRPEWAGREPWSPLLVGLDQGAAYRATVRLPEAVAAAQADLAAVQPQSPAWWERMTEATGCLRLEGSTIYRLVREVSPNGKLLSPHRIRHSSITAAVRDLGLSLADAQVLADHQQPSTTCLYLDRKEETQAAATNALAKAGAALMGVA